MSKKKPKKKQSKKAAPEKAAPEQETDQDKTTVEAVFRMLVHGFNDGDIKDFLKAEGLTASTAAKRLNRAFDELIKAAKIDQDLKLGWCIEAGRELFRNMTAIGDYPGALKAMKEVAILCGVYPGKKQPLIDKGETGDPDADDDIDDNELGKLEVVK